MKKLKLPKGYTLLQMPRDEFMKHFEKHAPKVFAQNLDYDSEKIITAPQKKKLNNLSKNFANPLRYRLCLAVFYKKRFVAWSWGYQYGSNTFYMCNSAVMPSHRRKGIYSYLLIEVVKRVSEQGFSHIFSRHIMTNNDIIISKLKMGFKITNFELSERFGNLIHLTYFPQKIRQDILDFRSGFKKPDKKMKKIFNI